MRTVGDECASHHVEAIDMIDDGTACSGKAKPMPRWSEQLTDEEQEAVAFARQLSRAPHGVDDHEHLLLIAKLATLLDGHEAMLIIIAGPGDPNTPHPRPALS